MSFILCVNTFMCMCTYIHRCVCGGGGMHVHTCLPESLFRCCFSINFLKQDLSMNLELINVVRFISYQKGPGTHNILPLQCWNYKYTLFCLLFTWVQGIQIQAILLIRKELYHPSSQSSLILVLFFLINLDVTSFHFLNFWVYSILT